MNKTLYILNPISGGPKSVVLHHVVEAAVARIPGAELVHTQYAGHARELALNAVGNGYDSVVAVGGDGTVNEVASALIGTETTLGIVPIGSGNGLARHLRIPLFPLMAIDIINKNNPLAIDYATINGAPFFCTAGVGFDAQVAADYSKAGTRGLITYTKEAIHDWNTYKPQDYVIETCDGTFHTQALLITCGNANQWGNGFFITPQASVRDGMLDIAVVVPAKFASNLRMVLQLRTKTLNDNPDVIFLKSPFVRIERQNEGAIHFDGESVMLGKSIFIENHPRKLNVYPGA